MKLRFILLALALAVVTVGAQAQIGVYFNPVATRISISKTDSGPFAFLGENTTSRFFGGIAMGGYYDFAPQPHFDFGIDVRDTLVHGNNASLNTFMVSARAQAKATRRLRPYLQLGIGAGKSKPELSLAHTTRAEWGAFVGVDYALNKHVDFRAIELGYGSVTTASSSIYGAKTGCGVGVGTACQLPSIPAATLINISSGLVFHFR